MSTDQNLRFLDECNLGMNYLVIKRKIYQI